MMKRIIVIAFTALTLSAVSVHAAELPPGAGYASGPLSGAELHGMCISNSDVDYGYCAGYVTAVAHDLLNRGVAGFRACNHTNVRSQQLVDTFNSWAELFPARLNLDAEAAVAASLARAFPCQN
jgi:hypothetical protein